MLRFRSRSVAVLLAALVAPVHLSAGPGPGGEHPPAKVVLQAVQSADFPVELEFPGRVSGSREVEVRAQVSGILQQRTYEEGSQVKQGQVLFRIDPRTYEAAVARAKAAVAQGQARYRQAERNLERIRQIQAKGFASGSELDGAVSEFEQSRANLEAAQAELKTRQIDLDYTTVKAPISGITSRETRSEGSLVVAGDPNASLLTQISQLDPVYVNFGYPDQVLERLRSELQAGHLRMPEDGKLVAELEYGNAVKYPHSGRVDFTDSLISRGTGTINARAVVANPEQTLLPGQFVRMRITGLVYPDAIAVPERAVNQGPIGTSVFIVEDGKAVERKVSLGMTSKGQWLVLDGLKSGEQIIVEGLARVMPGEPVEVVPAADAAAAGDAK
jgi:membrane fusion protein (multidrug efflux system)